MKHTDLWVRPDGTARFGDRVWRCALGRAGVSASKREGDGATPVGSFALRAGFYRPDRMPKPRSDLPLRPLTPQDGWCDDPADPRYNQLVTLPYPARCEELWRADGVYDVVVPLGYNDTPVVPGHGSAIFLHVAREDWQPTEGCVALALDDLLIFLGGAVPSSRVVIEL